MRQPTSIHTRAPIGPRPATARLILAGELCILLGLCDFAARLNVAALAGSAGAIHRLSDIGPTLSASVAILGVSAVVMDYLERVCVPKK